MENEKETSPYISQQDINNFPFPYKLWLIVNSETCDFSKWNIDGTELELKIVGLDNYLSSPRSIFKTKNRSSFIDHLQSYGFEILKSDVIRADDESKESGEQTNSCPSYSEFVMSFKHDNFLRHRIDLLAKIRRINAATPVEASPTRKKGNSFAERMEGDLCFMSYGTLSKIQKSRIKYQTVLSFQSETRSLQEKLVASELRSRSKGQEEDEEDVMIELPAEMFENPHDSVLFMGEEHRTAYAGFYGNCSNEQIVKFFGDYLPMYEDGNDDESERRVLDLNPPGRVTSSTPTNCDSTDADTTAQLVHDLTHDPSPPPVASSSLQPIFIPEDDGEDISMDDFIKFKEQTFDPQPNQTNEDPKIKMEVVTNDEDDNENEADFKNFFSQYRESLSLLYEKQ